MEKFSVKKPFTVLVAVIMVLMLGFVSITKMKTNLLPNVSTPYLMVVTVYPGASPERVETEVSDVLQNAQFFRPKTGILPAILPSAAGQNFDTFSHTAYG